MSRICFFKYRFVISFFWPLFHWGDIFTFVYFFFDIMCFELLIIPVFKLVFVFWWWGWPTYSLSGVLCRGRRRSMSFHYINGTNLFLYLRRISLLEVAFVILLVILGFISILLVFIILLWISLLEVVVVLFWPICIRCGGLSSELYTPLWSFVLIVKPLIW